MDLSHYIIDDALVLIPVLLVIGQFVKSIEKVPNKFIPIILLPLGVIGALALGGLSVQSAIQGVLVAGAAVYGNQIYKQLKDE